MSDTENARSATAGRKRWEHHRHCSTRYEHPNCDCRAEQEALLEIILWMSGAPAFGPGGEAHEAFVRDVQPLLLGDGPDDE